MKDSNAIIFFDDECVLCNKFAQWIIKNDKEGYFKFASFQSSFAKQLISTQEKKQQQKNSVILFQDKKIYWESDAALRIMHQLNGFKKYLFYFKIIPKPLRDAVYRVIAKNRYQWFGKTNQCVLDKSRMLQP